MITVSTFLYGAFFCFFSSSILSYLAIATMIGPWIAPTIVLFCNITSSILPQCWQSSKNRQQQTALIQAIGSIGGAIATGIGFSLPTLFFIDQQTFEQLLAQPFQFCASLTILCLCAGALGLALGALIAPTFTHNNQLPFPVSALTSNLISAPDNKTQSRQIIQGIALTGLITLLRDGFWKFKSIIPKTTYFFSRYLQQEFAFTVWPTMWAMGFAGGVSLIAPLLVGIFTKYIIIYPLHHYTLHLPTTFFEPISLQALGIAFCTGIVLADFFAGLYSSLKKIVFPIKNQSTKKIAHHITSLINDSPQSTSRLILLAISILSTSALFSYCGFPWSAQLLFFILCAIATYYICFIGCKIGLIQYGRFSAYVLIPLYLLFSLTPLQVTIIMVFFNTCAATASDLLFDLKTNNHFHIPPQKTWIAQWIGLVITTFGIGIIFYLLFSHFSLGSPDFFAQRSQGKALLLQSLHFNPFIVTAGLIFGIIIKNLGLSPTMVFSGIIMPNSISIALTIGAFFSLFTPKNKKYTAFCAGIFTSESLWTISRILFTLR
ncbi:MAG: hypothetical protein US69_C0004G0027 [candidate division TM6 bacterium GW2011_GWF2_38_10]|nr:MAG: hypothetical protein US69_C0004G0027 [candidate division TM6 bacterium GW2011_GWF2_38_10]